MANAKPFSTEELKKLTACKSMMDITCFYRSIITADRKRIEELEKERDETEELIHINEKLNLRILKLKEIFELIAKSSDLVQGVGYPSSMASLHSLAQRGLTLIARHLPKEFTDQAGTVKRLRGALEPFMDLVKFHAIEFDKEEDITRITFQAKDRAYSLIEWDEVLKQARQAAKEES